MGGWLVLAAAGPLPARAQTSAESTTTGSTSISAPAALTVIQNLTFSITPSALNSGLTITAAAANGLNANFGLTGGQMASISIPATFDVTRVGGTETITVRTVGATTVLGGPGAQVTGLVTGSPFNAPVSVVGDFDGSALSFSVGGEVTVGNDLAPGQYQGVLTVIAQYN